ncbi:MAG: 5'-3' exonuclease [Actinomycetota bacterium]
MAGGLTLLVDASSLLFRAYFSTPTGVTAPDGRPINAAHGFLNMLARLVADQDPDFLACATDEDWRPEWRVQLLPSYKEHRLEPGSPQARAEQDLAFQLPLLLELLGACRVPVLGLAGYEAEDVIGTLAARASGPVAIVSGDRDLFQLVRDPDVWVLYPRRGVTEMERVDQGYIESKYGIPGRAYADYAVLRGDPSDGLPGVRGIGEKTASDLLARYGSLDAVIDAAAEAPTTVLSKVRMQLDYVRRARKVVAIPTALPLPDADLSRPSDEPGLATWELAKRYALTNALGRLVAALTKRAITAD